MQLIYPATCTPAGEEAIKALRSRSYAVTDHFTPEITHLLLDIPSFRRDGTLRSGQNLEELLSHLPSACQVIGGNLHHPALSGIRCLDLLCIPDYTAKNASITAHCALKIAMIRMGCTFDSLPVLVIGWGRIGKCLCRLLRGLDAHVTICPHSQQDIAIARALGYAACSVDQIQPGDFRLVFNTAPTQVFTDAQAAAFRSCLKFDLASTPGIPGNDVIDARGLPGIYAPESSGALIAHTVETILKEGSQ